VNENFIQSHSRSLETREALLFILFFEIKAELLSLVREFLKEIKNAL